MKKIKLLSLIAIILIASTPIPVSATKPINPKETSSNSLQGLTILLVYTAVCMKLMTWINPI
jgi:hypothetical protein